MFYVEILPIIAIQLRFKDMIKEREKFIGIIYFIDIYTLSLIYLAITFLYIINRDTYDTFGIKVDWINVLYSEHLLSKILNIQYCSLDVFR